MSIQTAIWVIGGIFGAGITYSHVTHVESTVQVLERRLDKKSKIIEENKKEIVELKIRLAKFEK